MAENVTRGYNNSAYDNNGYNDSGYDNDGYDTSINDTSEYSSDIRSYLLENLIGETAYFIIQCIIFAVTLAAIVYGVAAWCYIKKFRHFRNYVLLSAIIANFLSFIVVHIFFFLVSEDLMQYYIEYLLVIYVFFSLSFRCWLLVLCYVFYVDFVKVFRLDIHRRFLKSSLFAWGVPFITVSPYFLIAWLAGILLTETVAFTVPVCLILIPVMISLAIYVAALYSLFYGTVASKTSSSKWSRFYIATLIFVLSDIIVLTGLLQLIEVNILIIDGIRALGVHFNTIALAMYLMIVKSNREISREFLNRRLKIKKDSLERK